MKRKDFLKSIGAILIAPKLLSETTEKTTDDLLPQNNKIDLRGKVEADKFNEWNNEILEGGHFYPEGHLPGEDMNITPFIEYQEKILNEALPEEYKPIGIKRFMGVGK